MPTIDRVRYSARSRDEALDFVARTYECFRPQRPAADADAVLEYHSAGSPGLDAARFAYSLAGGAAADPTDGVSIVTNLRGTLQYQSRSRAEVRIGPKESFMLPSGESVRSTWSAHEVAMLRVGRDQIQRVAQERIGSLTSELRFLDTLPVDQDLGRFWHNSQLTVTRQLLEDPAMEHPLLHQAALDFICTALLASFPHTAARQHSMAGPESAAPRSIRRAMAFIDEHAAMPLTISDIAAAAGVTPRALQQGFARHLEMRPMEYLRTVRLERAHLELRAADPALGTNVAEVARRWGFGKPDRFAAAYRRAYGVSPSQTLRSL